MLTDKQVEDGFSYEPEYEYANPTDTGYVNRNRRAFREWKAGVVREAEARALEEAADGIFVQHSEPDTDKRMAFNRGADAVYDALRARAAEIRERKS